MKIEELWKSHEKLAYKIIHGYLKRNHLPSSSFPEYLSTAYLAFFQAAVEHEPQKGKLSTLMTWKIMGALKELKTAEVRRQRDSKDWIYPENESHSFQENLQDMLEATDRETRRLLFELIHGIHIQPGEKETFRRVKVRYYSQERELGRKDHEIQSTWQGMQTLVRGHLCLT